MVAGDGNASVTSVTIRRYGVTTNSCRNSRPALCICAQIQRVSKCH